MLTLDRAEEVAGWPATVAGDVNGDGFDDLAVNAVGNPYAELSGRLLLYYGSAAGVPDRPDWQAVADDLFDQDEGEAIWSSIAFAPAGDLNGDGYGDLAQTVRDLQAGKSHIFVYYGGAKGPEPIPQRLDPYERKEFLFGMHLAAAGDVNGDGYGDLAVLSLDDDAWRAVVSVYVGSSQGLSSTPAWTIDDILARWYQNPVHLRQSGR